MFGRLTVPQLVDQAIDGNGMTRADREDREQGALATARDLDSPAVGEYL